MDSDQVNIFSTCQDKKKLIVFNFEKKNVFIFQNVFALSGPKIKRIRIQRDMNISQYVEAPVTDRSHSFYTLVYFNESPIDSYSSLMLKKEISIVHMNVKR